MQTAPSHEPRRPRVRLRHTTKLLSEKSPGTIVVGVAATFDSTSPAPPPPPPTSDAQVHTSITEVPPSS